MKSDLGLLGAIFVAAVAARAVFGAGHGLVEAAGLALVLAAVCVVLVRRRDSRLHAGEMRRLKAKLQETEARMAADIAAERSVAHRVPDPMLILAHDTSLIRANAAARAMFGDSLAATLRQPGVRAAIGRARTDAEVQEVQFTLAGPVTRELLARVVPLTQALGDGGRLILLLSDLTRELAVEKVRADFVANASHELRTPLASLIGFIETLSGPAAEDRAAQRRFLPIMAEQAKRMNRVIDDLLDLSRVEVEEHARPNGRVDLAEVVANVVRLSAADYAKRCIRVEVSSELSPAIVAGDHDQLARLVQNLLDNAIKYGRENGRVRVVIAGSANGIPSTGKTKGGITLAISDDGCGIARVHIPRLTERFYRVPEVNRQVKGVGLGLSIVKHIVNRHRGVLTITSQENIGTTVTVALPAADAENVEASAS